LYPTFSPETVAAIFDAIWRGLSTIAGKFGSVVEPTSRYAKFFNTTLMNTGKMVLVECCS